VLTQPPDWIQADFLNLFCLAHLINLAHLQNKICSSRIWGMLLAHCSIFKRHYLRVSQPGALPRSLSPYCTYIRITPDLSQIHYSDPCRLILRGAFGNHRGRTSSFHFTSVTLCGCFALERVSPIGKVEEQSKIPLHCTCPAAASRDPTALQVTQVEVVTTVGFAACYAARVL
jgi:hypothetical protein